MNRRTRSISLALIGSSLVLAGCAGGRQDQEEETRRRMGVIPIPVGGRAVGSQSGASASPGDASHGATSRGGFGSSGRSTSVGS